MALLKSQLSPRIQNAREKEGANGKMLWWKWCDAPFGESRAWKSNLEPGLLDVVNLDYDKMKLTLKMK